MDTSRAAWTPVATRGPVGLSSGASACENSLLDQLFNLLSNDTRNIFYSTSVSHFQRLMDLLISPAANQPLRTGAANAGYSRLDMPQYGIEGFQIVEATDKAKCNDFSIRESRAYPISAPLSSHWSDSLMTLDWPRQCTFEQKSKETAL